MGVQIMGQIRGVVTVGAPARSTAATCAILRDLPQSFNEHRLKIHTV